MHAYSQATLALVSPSGLGFRVSGLRFSAHERRCATAPQAKNKTKTGGSYAVHLP